MVNKGRVILLRKLFFSCGTKAGSPAQEANQNTGFSLSYPPTDSTMW